MPDFRSFPDARTYALSGSARAPEKPGVKSFIGNGVFWTTSFISAKVEWNLIPQQDQVESEFVTEYADILRKLLGPATLSSVYRALCGTALPAGSRINVFSKLAYRENLTYQSEPERLISSEIAVKDACANKTRLEGQEDIMCSKGWSVSL